MLHSYSMRTGDEGTCRDAVSVRGGTEDNNEDEKRKDEDERVRNRKKKRKRDEDGQKGMGKDK